MKISILIIKENIKFTCTVLICLFLSLTTNAQDTVFVSEDTFVRSGISADNNYARKLLLIKDTPDIEMRAWLKFDVSAYSNITSAILHVFGNQGSGSPFDISVHKALDSWSESTLTWNNAPATFSSIGTITTAGDTDNEYKDFEVDVTSYVQSQLRGGDNIISLNLAVASSTNKLFRIKNREWNRVPAFLSIISTNNANFYIDATNGNDSNNGTSESTPWKTINNVNTTLFQPGDSILFKAGESWTGTIKPQGSGKSGRPITIGKYGSGVNPIINGDGTVNCTSQLGKTKYCTLYLNNQEYWEIRDLELTNYDSTEEGGISLEQWESNNITDWVNVFQPLQDTGINTEKCAILVEGNNMGAINYLHFINLEIHGVNGDISEKDNGGIFLKIFNYSDTHTPTYFNDLLFENCYIHDVDRTGISNRSDYDNRTLTTNTDWTPTLNYIARHNTFERTGANALIFRVAESPLVEHNLFTSCSIKGSGNAFFNFNTDNALMRFNEGRFTKYNVGDIDAGGIDSDFRTKNTTIEYNYIHDNDYGILITGGPGNGTGFNDNTIFRYNILENDGILEMPGYGAWAFKISGNTTNAHVYNNVIYIGATKSYTDIVYHKSWGGGIPDGTVYNNNIFYNQGSNTKFNITSSTNNTFSNNIFYGNDMLNEPSDVNKVTSDPMLSNPGGGENGYTLNSDSPALARGLRFSTTPDKDYYQNTIPSGASIDIGVEQVTQVFVEPVVPSIVNVIEDTYIRGGSSSTLNYGLEDEIIIKESNNQGFTRRGLLQFDLTNYTSISSAKLFLYGKGQSNSVLTAFKAFPDTWAENTITWSNTTTVFTSIINSVTLSSTNQWYEIDVTIAAKNDINGNKTFSIGLKDNTISGDLITLYSKENTQNFAAYLEIVGVSNSSKSSNKKMLIEENHVQDKLLVYPNPVSSILKVYSPTKINAIDVIAIDGRLVKSFNSVMSENFEIDFTGIDNGFYIMNVKYLNGDTKTKKILVNNN